jgi:sugar-specific transcriptional regulator TrmB
MTCLRQKAVPFDPLNRNYRDTVTRLVDMAQDEIVMIVGEIGAYKFIDIRWGLEEAIARGVKVRVYAYKPRIDIRNRLVELGVKLYIGSEEPPERYIVIDGKHWYHAAPGREKRAGDVHFDDPKGSATIIQKFQEYIKDKEPADKCAWEDPLLELIED